MNRTLLACVFSLLLIPMAVAQPSATRIVAKVPQNTPVTKAPANGTTRVAVVNLGIILTKYERASALKEEMQTAIKNLQEEAKRLQENINLWQSAVQKNEFKEGTKEEYEEKLIKARRRIEDLSRLAQTKFGKMSQTHLLTLWSDVHEAVKDYCGQHHIDLVIAYGEPVKNDAASIFQSITRKIGAVDGGGSMPIFMAPGVDISEAVTEFLNKRYRDSKDNDN